MISDNQTLQDKNTSLSTAEPIENKETELVEDYKSSNGSPATTETDITREQLSLGKRLLDWKTIVPLVIVILALAWYIKQANIDPQKTWNAMRSANILLLGAAFLVYYLSFPIRALRWRLLLENVGFTKQNNVHLPKFWKLVEIVYISWFANVIVPAKLGDLYRAYLLRQEIGVSATRSFGTVLAERLLDLIVLLLLFIPAVIISLHGQLPTQLELGLNLSMAAVVIGVIGLFMLRIFRQRIGKLVPARFREQYNHFQEGTLGSFRRLPLLTGLTIGTWACESLRFFFVALALNLIGGDPVHIITAAFFIALGEALLTAVPFTGGGVGLVEGGMLAMIALFNQGTSNATSVSLAAIVLDRTISLLSILVIGFIVFMIAFGRQATKQTK